MSKNACEEMQVWPLAIKCVGIRTTNGCDMSQDFKTNLDLSKQNLALAVAFLDDT